MTHTHTHIMDTRANLDLSANGVSKVVDLNGLLRFSFIRKLAHLRERQVVKAHVDAIVQDRKILKQCRQNACMHVVGALLVVRVCCKIQTRIMVSMHECEYDGYDLCPCK